MGGHFARFVLLRPDQHALLESIGSVSIPQGRSIEGGTGFGLGRLLSDRALVVAAQNVSVCRDE